jgi:hypothetical protein
LRPSELFESPSERHQACLHFRIAFGVSNQHTNPAHLAGVLRGRSERPSRRCAAEKLDEMTSLHDRPFADDTYHCWLRCAEQRYCGADVVDGSLASVQCRLTMFRPFADRGSFASRPATN